MKVHIPTPTHVGMIIVKIDIRDDFSAVPIDAADTDLADAAHYS